MDAPTIENMPSLTNLGLIAGLVAMVSYAGTDWAKQAINHYGTTTGEDTWKYQHGLRALAFVLGCLGGWLIGDHMMDMGWWGVAAGATGAINSSLFVKIFRNKIAKAANAGSLASLGEAETPKPDKAPTTDPALEPINARPEPEAADSEPPVEVAAPEPEESLAEAPEEVMAPEEAPS